MDGRRTFHIDHCLGRGGFGEVYQARMTRAGGMEREVALKVLRRDIDPDGQAVRRLRDEGRLLAAVHHPTILKVFDLVVLDGRIALVTELVDGEDLTACLQGEDKLGPRALVEALARVAGALQAAWGTLPEGRDTPLRMVHRDIKPSNIRISRHGHVKLLDFGIARTDAVERESRTRTGMMVGSPAYMAPERFIERDVLVESDVFSIAAVLYEGLVGERFYGTLPIALQIGLSVSPERFAAHAEEQLAKVVDGELASFLRRVLVHDPTSRPDASTLRDQLVALADDLRGPSLERWCRNRTWKPSRTKPGDLDGRSVIEAVLERPAGPGSLSPSLVPGTRSPSIQQSLDAPTLERPADDGGVSIEAPQPAPRPIWGSVALAAVALLGVSLVLGSTLAGSGLVGSALWMASAEQVDGQIVPEPVVEVEALPAPEPVQPAPTPVVPEPAVVAPRRVAPPSRPSTAPAPEPEPDVPPLVTEEPGHVVVRGAEVAFAVSPSGRTRLPAHLAPGAYTVRVSFNGVDLVDADTIRVHSGERIEVTCSARMERCSSR